MFSVLLILACCSALSILALSFAMSTFRERRRIMKKGTNLCHACHEGLKVMATHLPPLPALADTIAQTSACDIIEHMKHGTVSCFDVMVTYCHRSYSIGHLKLNAVTEGCYPEAIA